MKTTFVFTKYIQNQYLILILDTLVVQEMKVVLGFDTNSVWGLSWLA